MAQEAGGLDIIFVPPTKFLRTQQRVKTDLHGKETRWQ